MALSDDQLRPYPLGVPHPLGVGFSAADQVEVEKYPNIERGVREGYVSRSEADRVISDNEASIKFGLAPAPPIELGSGGCTLSMKGRGDCEHFIGLPGLSIPGQHDGPDDTVDEYGKPNGWCWSCWKSHQIEQLRAEVNALEAWQDIAAESNKDVEAYLLEKLPSLDAGGMPIDVVRRAFESLETPGLSSSEALYGFCGWLTTQDTPTIMSKCHDAGCIVDLIAKFCKTNNLPEPRNHWEGQLEHPRTEDQLPSPVRITKIGVTDHPASTTDIADMKTQIAQTRSLGDPIAKAIDKLSGDLSYSKVSEAKEILKRLVE